MASDITITSLTAVGAVGQIILSALAGAPAGRACLPYMLPAKIEFWSAATNDRTLATKIGESPIGVFTHTGLTDVATRYFWAQAVDPLGELGEFYPYSATAGIPGGASNAAVTPLLNVINQRITDEVNVLVDADNAAIDRVEEVELTISNPETGLAATASAVQSLNIRVGDTPEGFESFAEAILGVAASVDDVTAEGLIKFEVMASPGGGIVRMAILARKTVGDTPADTGFYLDVFPDNSTRIAIRTDRLTITDGLNTKAPFEFTGGVLYVDQLVVNGTKIDPESIATDRAANNAWTTANATFGATVTKTGTGSDASYDLHSMSITPDGGTLIVDAECISGVYASNNTVTTVYQILKGATVVRQISMEIDDTPESLVRLTYVDTNPGTTAVTWTFRRLHNSNTGTAVNHFIPQLRYQNSKK